MKTTFKQYLQEAILPKAVSEADLLASIWDGKFTKDGSHLTIAARFDCTNRKLTSLIGAPSTVVGSVYCGNNDLTSLEGSPAVVGNSFYCANNKLTSLKGVPTTVGGHFMCTSNNLSTLKWAPALVNGDFECSHNNLSSLKDIHKYIHEIKGKLFLNKNPIESHVLGLLKIKHLSSIEFLDNKKVQKIINKYLPEGDMFACQQELIDAGLEAFAKL